MTTPDPLLPADDAFDRDWTLAELLPEALRRQVVDACARLLPGFTLSPGALPDAVPVRYEIDTLASLSADAPREQLAAAALLIEQILKGEARYRMASTLHLEAIRHDFEELARRNEELAASETRYRELAESLERRVEEQVLQIEQTQRQLYQAEKMVSLGQLAAGVAHEVNNPLGFIRSNLNSGRSYLDELRESTRPNPGQEGRVGELLEDFAALLGESIEGADRVAHIVSSLKDFSGVDGKAVAIVDLNQIIEGVLEVAHGRLAGFNIERAFSPLPTIRCHAANIGQVVLQLLLNAADAVQEGGLIRISTGVHDGSVVVSVEDDGSGIAPEHLSRVFDPFFSTKPVGKGAGLGLTVSNDTVRAHGGHITLESTPGAGSRFSVFLPVASV